MPIPATSPLHPQTPPTRLQTRTALVALALLICGDAAVADDTSYGHGLLSVLDLTPGSLPDPAGTAEFGEADGVSILGATGLENRYEIDGLDTTGLTLGGPDTTLPREFIEEIEVLASGRDAAYGGAAGGAIRLVTKSGSNEWHGSVFAHIMPTPLIAPRRYTPTQLSPIDGERHITLDTDLGAELGGPIEKDKLWFYVGLAPRTLRTTIDRVVRRRIDCDGRCESGLPGDGVPDRDPDTGMLALEEVDRTPIAAHWYAIPVIGSLHYAPSWAHQGQFSAIATPLWTRDVDVHASPAASRRDIRRLTTDTHARWTSKLHDARTELGAFVGWHRRTRSDTRVAPGIADLPRETLYHGDLGRWAPLGGESANARLGCADGDPADPYPDIVNCPDTGAGYSIRGPGLTTDETDSRWVGNLTAIRRTRVLGPHEIALGVGGQLGNRAVVRTLSGGVAFENRLPRDTAAGAPDPRAAISALRLIDVVADDDASRAGLCGPADSPDAAASCVLAPARQTQADTAIVSTYLADSWSIKPNLTINAGLRYSRQRLGFADHLRATPDPTTGIERRGDSVVIGGMWSPRLGISYDWTREGRAKLYAHWGRYHQWLPMAIADRALSGQTWHRMDFDPAQCGAVDPARGAPDPANCPGVRPPNTDAANTAARGESLVGAGTLVTPGLAGGYTDEAVLGVEYEALEDLLVGVAYIHRGLGRAVEDLSLDGGATRVLANPGAWSFEQEARLLHALSTTADPNARRQLATQLAHYRGARRFDPPRRDYDALQLTFRRRLHGSWFAQGSYTVSALRGDYPGLASADNGVHLPGASSQYDLVELAGNRRGPLPLDRRHNFKLDALYFRVIGRGVVGLTTRLRVISGAPIDALAAHPVYGQAESFLLPRGAIGRTDTDVGLDLRLSYTRAPTRRTRLEVFAEIFNALHRQTAIAVDERYTLDPVRPIIGGDRADLIWAKADAIGGAETGLPAQRNPDFQRPTERRLPLAIRLGAQLSF